jgi:hypothetical protein
LVQLPLLPPRPSAPDAFGFPSDSRDAAAPDDAASAAPADNLLGAGAALLPQLPPPVPSAPQVADDAGSMPRALPKACPWPDAWPRVAEEEYTK